MSKTRGARRRSDSCSEPQNTFKLSKSQRSPREEAKVQASTSITFSSVARLCLVTTASTTVSIRVNSRSEETELKALKAAKLLPLGTVHKYFGGGAGKFQFWYVKTFLTPPFTIPETFLTPLPTHP